MIIFRGDYNPNRDRFMYDEMAIFETDRPSYMHGMGLYFTDSKSQATGYGDTTYTVDIGQLQEISEFWDSEEHRDNVRFLIENAVVPIGKYGVERKAYPDIAEIVNGLLSSSSHPHMLYHRIERFYQSYPYHAAGEFMKNMALLGLDYKVLPSAPELPNHYIVYNLDNIIILNRENSQKAFQELEEMALQEMDKRWSPSFEDLFKH